MPINENQNEKVLSQTNLEIPRSRFQKTYENLTTFNPGYWFPVICQEVLPGENIKCQVKSLVRMLSPATPVMDQAFLDIASFYVPCRLCTAEPGQFEKMMGAVGEPDAWTTTLGGDDLLSYEGNYTSFNLSATDSSIQSMSLANYLGLPINNAGNNPVNSVSMLPFKAVTRIWNEWLRDENVCPSVDFGWDEDVYMTTPLNELCVQSSFHYFMSARKLKDYFTSALPAPQKGAVTSLPFLTSAPVVTANSDSTVNGKGRVPLQWINTASGTIVNAGHLGVSSSGYNTTLDVTAMSGSQTSVAPRNLVADLSNATGLTANDIRMVFGIQRLQEKLARGGSRWNEYLHALYGVQVNPGLVNMSVYLGGFTIDVNTQEVVQTSATSDVSPLGFPGAQSVNYGDHSFSAGFQEHGYVITLATVRVKQSYSQGIDPIWRRMHFHEFFQPTLSFIGEQPIYQEELFPTTANARYNASGVANSSATIFGYKPAWEEYRKPKKLVTGNFAPDSKDASLSVWSYTTYFATKAPQLNGDFIREDSTNLLKTLVDTKTKTAFIGDFVILCDDYTPVPLNSYAGLIDHF